MKETLIKLFGVNAFALGTNLEGISHEDSLRMPEPAGNCLNWTVGHIVHSRNQLLKMIGCEPVWADDHGAFYGRGGSMADPSAAFPLDDLVRDFAKSGEILAEGIGGLTDDALGAPVSAGFPGKLDTLGEGIAFMQFHEAYHVGQAGLLRRLAGKPGGIA